MRERNMIFLDGFMVPSTNILAQALAPGILSGRGVFETMRAYRGKIFALEEHIQRLFYGLEKLKVQAPCSRKKMKHYLQKALITNQLQDARLRLIVWKAKQGVRISIATFPYRPLSKKKYQQGFSAIFSDIRRDESSEDSRIKSINYLPLLLAQRKAKTKGYDEAILLNSKGFVAEGSKTNIFLVRKGILKTPSLSCGCLNGITRQKVLEIARKKKIICRQASFFPDELLDAEEAFCTNSLIEIMPLTCIHGKIISQGKTGFITDAIIRAYQKCIQVFLNKD